MDFDLTEDQRAFQATARQFARDEMMPRAREWDENETFPVEALRKAAALGFGGIYVKDDVGGTDLQPVIDLVEWGRERFRRGVHGRASRR